MIEVRHLRRTFGAFALQADLRAGQGDYMVILGPSGCGKSLLLGSIAGLYAPDQGSIWIGERNVTRLPPEQRGVGFVFQKSSLFPHLDVLGNIEFGLRVRGVDRQQRRARAAELVQVLGLQGVVDRPVPTLSGGEQQRVAIARALAPRPEVLLLDEPLSLVDHNTRLELQEQLRKIHESMEVTALHVTHNREEARALGSHCAVMLGGLMVQQGEMDAVLESPRCVFVAHFLGLGEGPSPEESGCTQACLEGTGRCDAQAATELNSGSGEQP